MACPDAETLQALVEEQPRPGQAEVRLHVDGCARCQALVAALRRPDTEPQVAGGELPAGTVVDRFVVEEKLGGGGMGIVYAARDPELHRRVALKLLRPARAADDDGGSEARARMKREAQALAQVSDPHVITVFDVGSYKQSTFIAMELIDGGTMRDWLRERPRGWREVLHGYLAAARGLIAAHAVGVIHRDFKPDNVLVGRDGRVRVTDFGLARRGPGAITTPSPAPDETLEEALTRTGALLGTPAYMSPEQFAGTATDARTDQFSFCVALYEALYGARPFDARSGSRVIARPPAKSPVPAAVGRVLLRGLRTRPADRFPSLPALVSALQRAARPRRWPWVAAAAAVAAALLAFWLASRPRHHGGPPAAIAVVNLGGEKWLATALEQMLEGELGADQIVRTVDDDTVERAQHELGDAGRDPARLAARLGVGYLVDGSAELGAGGLRVELRLIDAAGETLATFHDEATSAGMPDLVGRAGARIRRELGIPELDATTARQAREALPANLEATRQLMDGLERLRENDRLEARQAFERTVAADPRFAFAHAHLATMQAYFGGPDAARASVERALALARALGREDQLWVEARAAGALGQTKQAVEAYAALYRYYPAKFWYGVSLASQQFNAGQRDDARRTIQSLRAAGPPVSESIDLDYLEMLLAQDEAEYEQIVASAARLEAHARADGVLDFVAIALRTRGSASWYRGALAQAVPVVAEAMNTHRQLGDLQEVRTGLRILTMIAADRGRLAEARARCAEAASLSHDLGSFGQWRRDLMNAAWLALRQGRMSEAQGLGALAFELRGDAAVSLGHALIPLELGELVRARQAADRVVSRRRDRGELFVIAEGLVLRAEVLRALGEATSARVDLDEALAMQERGHWLVRAAWTRLALAGLALDDDDAATALGLATQALPPFEEQHIEPGRLAAGAILARARARRGDRAGALTAAAGIRVLAPTVEDVPLRWRALLAAAEVAAAPAAAEAVRREAEQAGYALVAKEARLTLARLRKAR